MSDDPMIRPPEAENTTLREPASLRRQPGRRRSRLARWLLWTGAVLLLLVIAAAAAAAYLFHRAQPILRASLLDTVQKQFHARAELDDLRISILDGFSVEGGGLRIWLPAETLAATADLAGQAPWRAQPWIVVDKLRFHASWRILPGKPIEVSVVHIERARVLLPPKEDRPHFHPSEPAPEANPANPTSAGLFKLPPVRVQRIECQNAQLIIERNPEPGKPPKIPLQFAFAQLTVIPEGDSGLVSFAVDMTNPRPVGNIHSTGHAGPWVPSDTGALPIDGDYSFDHADLSTIKGIAGILSSTGRYSGTLRRIEADGTTNTPDFRLERVARSSGLPLTTRFHAIVDGTNGDTLLQPVDATLGHTHILAQGKVVRAAETDPTRRGHDIQIEVAVDRGRIEDILHISADSAAPFLTGSLTFHSSFHLPPSPPSGEVSILDRLLLDGQFHLSQARFTHAAIQGKIEQLSLRGQGKPKELKTSDPAAILSDADGHFKLANGVLQLPDLQYRVPGASILVHGTYGLAGGTLNFQGEAKMDATLSQMVGGWKGLLLKPADRYLRKNGAGTDIPIRLSGTRKDPSFGVEFDRLGKTDKPSQQQ